MDKKETGNEDIAPRLPSRRAGNERARPTGREPMVLKGRRGERVGFSGAGRKARQPSALAKGPAALTLISCLVQSWRCNREANRHDAVPEAEVKGSDGND